MPSKYDRQVDPNAPNDAHAYELELVGWNRRVLELGAASGHMTRALVTQRCRVTSIERDAEAASDLEGVADEIIIGDLDDPSVLDELRPEFDTVLAGDILEHLLHPQDVLANAVKLLAPGGQVVVAVPNVGHVDIRLSLVQGNWDYRSWGLMDDSHIRFFTLKSIDAMVKEAGLIVTDLRRVRIPAFESELTIDREAVPIDVLDLVLADPEAETYQFVFSAAVANGDYKLRRLADQNYELEQHVTRLRVMNGAKDAAHELATEDREAQDEKARQTIAALEAEVASLRTAVASLESEAEARQGEASSLRSAAASLLGELAASQATVSSLYGELTAADRRMQRVEGSVLWRLLQRVRTRLVVLLGGNDSRRVRAAQATLRLFGRALLRRADD